MLEPTLYTRVPMMRASAAATAVLMVVGNAGAEQKLEVPSLAPPSIEHPRWEPSWQMNQSTIIMTCNQSGYTTATNVSKFAIVDYDVRPTTARAAATAAATTYALPPLPVLLHCSPLCWAVEQRQRGLGDF